MDTKRLIAALALSLIVLFGWSYLFPPDEPKPLPVAAQPDAKLEQGAKIPAPVVSASAAALAQGRAITVKTPLYTARFNTQGGVLESFVLNNFRETIRKDAPHIDIVGKAASDKAALGLVILPAGGEVHTWNAPGWTFEGTDAELSGSEKKTLVFVGEAAGLKIERRLTLSADTYLVTEETTVTNPGSAPVSGRVAFTIATAGLSPTGEDQYNPTRIAYGTVKSGFNEVTDHGDLEKKGVAPEEKINWAAVESNYFLFAAMPKAEDALTNGKLKDGVFNLAVSNAVTFEAGQAKTVGCSYYMGPADRAILAKMPNKLEQAVDFGWFHLIAVPLLFMLNWFYGFVHNYGVAVVLLTVLIKIIFWPLSHKSYKSMEQMKKIQPMIQKLREKYADDKELMNKEIMSLYKTYKVNPAGGCLPMVVQIPVFFGLYKALLGSIELRHAPFIANVPFTDIVWLADLSAKDPYYVTPVIMGATMFIQQKMTPTGGDPLQAKIMLLMPVVFTFLFLSFPAGLVVYWLVNNVLSIAQQWWMIRKA
ncbi:MAG: membrane protein insertase YidC [Humidesulfovibrio sp.]|uniref:membrane protein insertase YidC n=1 Tax=Humidesulfovibrio sp. TaxID=2910988 RepID=UPI0027328673|nr:membrane protein insertase YidC [Humidesulfovibrio sp.]MDP2849378.1 membrane protein insertase YidC [Humidesulfovibrio sp.]